MSFKPKPLKETPKCSCGNMLNHNQVSSLRKYEKVGALKMLTTVTGCLLEETCTGTCKFHT